MKQLVMFVLVLIAAPMTVFGQNTILQKINAIKSQDNAYFWYEFTHPVADSAVYNATRFVLNEINFEKDDDEKLSMEEIMPYVKSIKMDRGSLKRAFVYVEKSNLPSKTGGILSAHTPSVTSSRQISTMAPVTQMQGPVNQSAVAPVQAFVPDVFVQQIMQQKDFYKVYNFLKGQKASGQILQFGPLKDVEDYSSLDLILFDMQSREVLGVLSPITQGNTRVNLVTGAADSMDNYPEDMLLVMWYIK